MPDPKRLTGTLIRLRPEGYGFIHVRDGGDYFVHLKEMRDRADWFEGTEVSFITGPGKPRKAPPAYDVVASVSSSPSSSSGS